MSRIDPRQIEGAIRMILNSSHWDEEILADRTLAAPVTATADDFNCQD